MMFRKWMTYSLMFSVFTSQAFAVVKTKKNAADVYDDLQVQGVTFDKTPLKVEHAHDSNWGIVTFGAEKEGIDFGIANVMGPSAKGFKKFINSLDLVGKENRKLFLKDFLTGIASKQFSVLDVKDVNNVPKNINFGIFKKKKISTMSGDDLYALFKLWLDQTEDRPFSFIKPEIRELILTGKLQGNNPVKARNVLAGKYFHWSPNFGLPQKYIVKSEPAANYIHRYAGYEMQFSIMNSYGEFEEFLSWLKGVMKTNPEDVFSKAPGQQRIVWPDMQLNSEDKKMYKSKTGELYKNIQAHIVLSEIANHPGIMVARWREILKDKKLASLKTWKGPIRAEHDRWAQKTGAIEIRAGVKTPSVQKFLHKTIVSRVATNDWGNIQDANSWKLVPDSLAALDSSVRIFSKLPALTKVASRFDLDRKVVSKFFNVIKSKYKSMEEGGRDNRRIDVTYLAPLWHWERAPYLSDKKKEIIKSLTQDFIHYIAKNGDKLDFDGMQDAIRRWVQTASIQRDIEDYLMPKRVVESKAAPHEIVNKNNGNVVDVNKIDVGIEYTGRMPIKDLSLTAEEDEGGQQVASAKKKEWVNAKLGLTPAERESIIKNLAQTLSLNVGNKPSVQMVKAEPPKKKEEDNTDKKEKNHGHGISLSYSFNDPNGGEWRVEWDGIGRTYDPKGNVIPGSTRGGHIELVTPRGQLTTDQINAVFKSFQQNSVIPGIVGGGHINVDLAPFQNNPKAFARFLTLFHKYRGTISTMFQHPNRMRTSEPARVSPEFHKALQNFDGTEDELKQMLYNNKYFNNRLGRKSRYMQLDVSSYFQDVIPAEFISQDFDINSPVEIWRQQFRVKPLVRKMEFRMMDAPRTADESAKQLKLVRALLNKAFNETTAIEGDHQEVDHEKHANNADLAFKDLQTMTADLGLNFEEYKGFMGDRVMNLKQLVKSKFYRPLADKLKFNVRVEDVWGKAVKARPMPGSKEEELALQLPSAETTEWHLPDGKTLTEPLDIAVEFKEKRLRVSEKGERVRLNTAQKIKDGDASTICFRREKADFGLNVTEFLEVTRRTKKANANKSANKNKPARASNLH